MFLRDRRTKLTTQKFMNTKCRRTTVRRLYYKLVFIGEINDCRAGACSRRDEYFKTNEAAGASPRPPVLRYRHHTDKSKFEDIQTKKSNPSPINEMGSFFLSYAQVFGGEEREC